MFPDVTIGIMTLLAVSGFLPACSSNGCDDSSVVTNIQKFCKESNEAVVYAEINQDSVQVCRYFPEVMKCSVRAQPHCYGEVEKLFIHYTHSPYNCELTQELIKDIQEILAAESETDRPTSGTVTTSQGDEGTHSPDSVSSSSVKDTATETVINTNGSHSRFDGNKGVNSDSSGNIVEPNTLPAVMLVLATTRMLLVFTT